MFQFGEGGYRSLDINRESEQPALIQVSFYNVKFDKFVVTPLQTPLRGEA